MRSFNRIQQLYILTFFLEPLLFFLVADRNLIGFSLNISRIIQLIVITELFIRYIYFLPSFKLNTNIIELSRGYSIFIFYGLFISFFGIIFGQYGNNNLIFPPQRALIEFGISIYYFLYFAILPTLLFPTKRHVEIIFKFLIKIFKVILIIGFLDLFLLLLGLPSLPRHLGDIEVGLRFHSLMGEPRDAAVYLIFMCMVLYLKNEFFPNDRNPSWLFISFIIIAFVLTVSVSGLLAIVLAFSLLTLKFLKDDFLKLPVKRLFTLIFLFLLFIAFILMLLLNERFQLYIEAFNLLGDLISRNMVPDQLSGQMVNIYPLWHRLLEVLDGNIFWTTFGSGIGTTSIVNNFYYDLSNLSSEELLNPHANAVRIFFENGIIGSLLLLFAFRKPFATFTYTTKEKNTIINSYLIILGAFLAHRTLLFFIALGLIFLVLKINHSDELKSEEI